MIAKAKPYYLIAIFSIINIFLASGCNFFEFFKSDKKQIKRQVERIKAGINSGKWQLVESLMIDEFQWTSTDKITYKTRKKGRKKKRSGKFNFDNLSISYLKIDWLFI